MSQRSSKEGVAPPPGLKSAVQKPSRTIPPTTRLFLYVKAGGRCEFDGCNAYLLEHHVTKGAGNYAEMAHIWAFSDDGPRGNGGHRSADIHDVSNLMLLCRTCHKHIDNRPDEFTVEVLRRHKKAHEERVFLLTDTMPDRDTVAVVLTASIAGRAVTVTLPEIQRAIAPRYCSERALHEINLAALPDKPTPEYWKLAAATIGNRMSRFYESIIDGRPPHHVSVFALAPIPLLMVLGSTLSDKVPTSLFQRHRGTESWVWNADGEGVTFATTRVRSGSDPLRVAMVVSVSGVISEWDLPDHVDETYTVYSLAPVGTKPDRSVFDVEASLHAFRAEYQKVMRMLVEEHPAVTSVEVFPAVPAPAAVAMGRDLLPKRDPSLIVFDFNKANGGFVKALEINRNGQ